MKIGFINYSDISGGAARATFTLAQGLLSLGNNLRLFVEGKETDFTWIEPMAQNFTRARLRSLIPSIDALPSIFYKRILGPQMSFNYIATNNTLKKKLEIFNPDIVNFHWVGGGYAPINLIKNIKIPIVISLYDMWAFTGGCHYDNFCNRYVEKCGSCPLLTSKRRDITSLAIALKQNAYDAAHITFVSPSQALTSAAKKSYLLKNQRIETIPHGLDFSRFKIIDRQIAREQLGIPKDRIYLLFGCTGGVNDERKGFKYIRDALIRMQNILPQNTTLLLFGTSNNPFEKTNLNFSTISIGKLYDDASLSLLYSAANITLMPSKQEALGLMSMESMACGTPVVGFGDTGLADIIEHQLTGYLSKLNDTEDFSRGILWTLQNVKNENRVYLRDGMIKKFEIKRVADMYEKLYMQLLHQKI